LVQATLTAVAACATRRMRGSGRIGPRTKPVSIGRMVRATERYQTSTKSLQSAGWSWKTRRGGSSYCCPDRVGLEPSRDVGRVVDRTRRDVEQRPPVNLFLTEALDESMARGMCRTEAPITHTHSTVRRRGAGLLVAQARVDEAGWRGIGRGVVRHRQLFAFGGGSSMPCALAKSSAVSGVPRSIAITISASSSSSEPRHHHIGGPMRKRV